MGDWSRRRQYGTHARLHNHRLARAGRLPRYALLLGLLLALLALPGAAPRALAQPSAISMSARAGYGDGSYRLAEWYPVVVDISNAGADLRGVLEWQVPPRDDGEVFQRTIDLPRGSRKRVVLDVYTSGFARAGLLRLISGSAVLAEQSVTLAPVDEGIFFAGVVSSDPALLNSLGSAQVAGFASAQVEHLAPADLPEALAELRAFNALFLHDLDTAALTEGQRRALAGWVGLGGQLVVSGGPTAPRVVAGLADLLPVLAVGELSQGDLSGLAGLAGASPAGLPASASVSRPQARPGAEPLLPGSDLLLRQRYGSGLVIFAAFDLASLRGWPAESALWSKVLRQVLPLAPGAGAPLSQFSLLDRGVLKLPSLNLPSPWSLVLFMLVYVLVIGPLNYLLLRRMRRLELAWLTVPAVVLLFTAGLYIVGIALRGGESQLNQLAVVQAGESQPAGQATAFLGLFSPRRATYNLGFPSAALVTSGPSQSFLNASFEPVVVGENGAPSLAVLADISSVTSLVVEAAVDLPLQVQSAVISDTQGYSGELRNTGGLALDDALLVSGGSFVRLGGIAPGESKRFVASDAQTGFPNSLGLAESGVFDRQAIMNLLFDRDILRFRNPGISGTAPVDAEGLYLLAWASQPTVDVSLGGQPASQNGLTLFVIRLNA